MIDVYENLNKREEKMSLRLLKLSLASRLARAMLCYLCTCLPSPGFTLTLTPNKLSIPLTITVEYHVVRIVSCIMT